MEPEFLVFLAGFARATDCAPAQLGPACLGLPTPPATGEHAEEHDVVVGEWPGTFRLFALAPTGGARGRKERDGLKQALTWCGEVA